MSTDQAGGTDIEYRVFVVDEARARLYRLTHKGGLDPDRVGKLHEIDTLIDPERRIRDASMFTESRPGLRRGAVQHARHGVDDHRDGHRDENRRRFAQRIWERTLGEKLGSNDHWVVATGPAMLGTMRAVTNNWRGNKPINIQELEANLAGLSPSEIHDVLSDKGFLPRRPRMGGDHMRHP